MQKKYWLVAGVVVVVIGLSFGGFEFWRHMPKSSNALGANFDALHSDQPGTSGAAGYTNGQDIPLTPAQSGGLSAESSPAGGNLGQLSGGSGNNGGANSSQQGMPSSGSSNNSGGSSGCNTQLNSSTFSQYTKYQNNPQALFGDMCTGSGNAVAAGSQVSVYYKGWLTDGTLFDESRAGSNGQVQPFSFVEGQHQVIPGWEEGLAGMKAGGTRLLVIPPALGYGANGQGTIPGNAVLVFEVQLLTVN